MNIGDVNKFVSAASKLPGRATNAPAGMNGAIPVQHPVKTMPQQGAAGQSDPQVSTALTTIDPQMLALQTRVATLEAQLAALLNAVSVGPSGNVTISSSARVELQASVITLSASLINLQSGMVSADGVVKCETMIADSVVASSYTPGAGNVW